MQLFFQCRRTTFLILIFLTSLLASAQTHTPVTNVTLGPKCNGYYEYLPAGYDPNGTTTYPLIVFLAGIGEMGDGTPAQINRVLVHEIPKLIQQGTLPTSFTVNGRTSKFIIITPQFKAGSNPTGVHVNEVIDYILPRYKVNRNRIYLTGFSYGGGLSWAQPGFSAAQASRIAAIVPVACPPPAVPPGQTQDQVIYSRSRFIAGGNIAVWAIHNRVDNGNPLTVPQAYVNYINQAPAPTTLAKLTVYEQSGHTNTWPIAYNPNFREGGLNVYEWMLQFHKGAPAVVNAGVDKSLTLPAQSIGMTATAADADGYIESYSWTKTSGPAQFTISNPGVLNPTMSNLVQGTYVFRLTVTDNDGATASDDVQVTVAPAPNQPPSVNAGTDKSITLPTNTVTLSGSASDADGTIAAYAWSKISGPAATIGAPSSPSPSVSNLVQGTYVFRLTVTDNDGATASDDVQVTVAPAPNQAPSVNAGTDKSITLPTNSVTLSGSASDADGTIAAYAWSKVSGPAATIGAPSSPSTSVSNLVQGTYVFRLTVTDNDGATASDDVQVIVAPAPNQAPSVNAGTDKSITLPTNSVTLSGSASDADGTIASYSWSKVSGPAATIGAPSSPSTSVSNLVQGTYVFRLTVTDNDGATASDDVQVVVAPAPNQAPSVNAGTDKSITLPTNSVTLSGSASDADGTIASYSWSKISGPAATIGAPSSPSTSVSNLVQGTYVFRLTVTDNDGATASDDVQVTVAPAPNQAPSVNAGTDKSITLPTNTVTLSGSASDADGTIASYSWSKVSGPAATIGAPSSPSTSVSNLVQGTYVFRLTVTDNDGATASDDVQVIVAPAPNQPPSVNAGTDKSITLPTNTVTLSGSASDADGTIASYSWSKVSGPAATIGAPSSPSTSVSNLVQGTYVFRLTVTDNDGATASDDVQVTVAPAPNQAPSVNAGTDKSITLPTNTVTLSGSASDADGTIASYSWSKISGPAATIGAPSSPSTSVSNLVQGTYVFRLTVTDNDGATASDDVQVTVAPAPPPAPKIINVNLFGGSDPYSNVEWNNWNVSASLNSGMLKYADGSSSTAVAALSKHTIADNGAEYGGGMAPAEVLRHTSYNKASRTLTLSGLSSVKKYNVEFYASRANTGNSTRFTINGVAVTVLTDGNKTSKASFTDLSPDAAGKIIVSINHVNTYNYLNGFILTENAGDGNQVPVSNAGVDKSVTLPVSTLSLEGSGTDVDGTIASYLWTRTSGPSSAVINQPSSATTSISNLVEGTYTFRLAVTDNAGATGFDDVEVVVLPAPPPAGTRFVKVNLFGGSNPYSNAEWNNWNVSSSLTSGTLAFSDNASSGITASISKHTLSDNGASYGGTMAPPEVLRYTSYGTAARTVTLSGLSATKTYNLELYAARANTGHSTTFTVAGSAVTILTDNNKSNKALFTTLTADASGKLVVSIASVNTYNYLNGFILTENVPAPGAPTADAGPDQGVSLPGSTTTLSGAASDADGGTITGYSWAKLSGGAATLSDPTAASTSVSGLVEGVYTFRLTVTDNDGLTAFDDVQVVVAAAPPPAGTRLVKVNLFGGSNPYGSPEWNNWNVSSSLSSGGLKYSDAATSGISAALSRSSGINDNGAGYGSGMAPAEVLRHSSSSTSSRTLTISGLSADKTYALELYASRGNYSGNFTGFTVDGATQSISTFNNLEQRAEFTNLTASATGKITVSITNAQSYNYLNGFILTEVETGAANAAIVSGGAAEAAGTSAGMAVSSPLEPGAAKVLGASVHPNPAQNVFSLVISGGDASGFADLKVWDVSGRVVDQRRNLAVGSRVSMGSNWHTGLYYAELTQGTQTITLKLIKQK